MLSTILSSERAIQVNIEIMRAFVRLRQMLASDAELSRRLNELEKKYESSVQSGLRRYATIDDASSSQTQGDGFPFEKVVRLRRGRAG